MIYASSAPSVAQSPSGARIVYFLNLGDAAALGGSLVVSSCCNRTTGNTLLCVGTGCPVGPVMFQCQVGIDTGDVAGQAACANAGASTVTIAGTTSRVYFVLLGHAPAARRPWPAWRGRARHRRPRRRARGVVPQAEGSNEGASATVSVADACAVPRGTAAAAASAHEKRGAAWPSPTSTPSEARTPSTRRSTGVSGGGGGGGGLTSTAAECKTSGCRRRCRCRAQQRAQQRGKVAGRHRARREAGLQ